MGPCVTGGNLTHAPASSSQEMAAFLIRAEPGESYGAGMQDTQVKTASLGLEERCAAHQQKD